MFAIVGIFILQKTARKLQMELEVSKPAVSGFGSVYDKLSWLSYETVQNTLAYSDFSLSELGQEHRPVALFLQFDESRLETMGSLLSLFYGHFFSFLIQNHYSRGPVALFFDEIGNIPPIVGLTNKLNTIASRNFPTWTYWQSVAQMSQKYGKNGPQIFFSSADCQIFFRIGDNETQKMVSLLIGTVKVRKISHTKSIGAGRAEQRSNMVSESQENVIEPHEVGELKKMRLLLFIVVGRH